jgi:acid phosphatase (class A)
MIQAPMIGLCTRGVAAVGAVLFATSALAQSAAPRPLAPGEIAPGILRGYLSPKDLPSSVSLVPPPPADGSAAKALDDAVSKEGLAFKGTARWAQAIEDANLKFPHAASDFSCALGAPVTEADTPHLYLLLHRTLTDAGLASYSAKNKYKRERPFMADGEPTCTPEEEPALRKDGSYPSGHTSIGWAWALILSEIAPDRQDAILARGRSFGRSRIVCHVHWESDILEGRFVGASTVARLHADPAFEADLAAAGQELAAARAKGLAPNRDCAAEAAALALDPPTAP